MNFSLPHFWTLLGFFFTVIGWAILLLKLASKWGKTEEQLSRLNKESDDRTNARINDPAWIDTVGRIEDLEKDSKRLRELKILEGDVLTFKTHEKMCGEHLSDFEKRLEKMIDLKLDAFESRLLLAIKTNRKVKK